MVRLSNIHHRFKSIVKFFYTTRAGNATFNMVGTWTITVGSETTTSGGGDLVIECEGSDCTQYASYTNSESCPLKYTPLDSRSRVMHEARP
jgi:hypothetical protein